MKELVFLLAGSMSKEELVEQMHKACSDYLSDPNDDHFSSTVMSAVLITTKAAIKKDGIEGAIESLEEYKQTEKIVEMFKDKNQN